MAQLAEQYLDLLASGDKERIECVLFGAAGGAVAGGVGLGIAFAPANAVPVAGTAINGVAAAIGAVLGGLAAGKAAMGFCGGASSGNLQRLLGQYRAPMSVVQEFEARMQREFTITSSEARQLSIAAISYAASPLAQPMRSTSSSAQRRHAVAVLLDKLGHA